MTRSLAASVWLLLLICAGVGCIPIYTPLVQQDITTGQKLRSIAHVVNGEEVPKQPVPTEADQRAFSEWAKDVRAQLLAGPPSMRASVRDPRQPPAADYSIFDPGLYSPINREREALARARTAGVLTDAEYTELDAMLEQQGTRSIVRRWFETAPVGVAGTLSPRYFIGGPTHASAGDSEHQWLVSGGWVWELSRAPRFDDEGTRYRYYGAETDRLPLRAVRRNPNLPIPDSQPDPLAFSLTPTLPASGK